mgnify:CR=1 FL=1
MAQVRLIGSVFGRANMDLNKIISYSLQGDTLTFVDRMSGYPLTIVYYRMK